MEAAYRQTIRACVAFSSSSRPRVNYEGNVVLAR
jgi:hypothetical protein